MAPILERFDDMCRRIDSEAERMNLPVLPAIRQATGLRYAHIRQDHNRR
jgi:hypothetical protein